MKGMMEVLAPRAEHYTRLDRKKTVVLFAGAGGSCMGIEEAYCDAGLDQGVDLAVNHDPDAISCHMANHPLTEHRQCDVFEVDPESVEGPIGLLWGSPDCTDFSKAKGGKPIRTTKRRSLAWVLVHWAFVKRPDVIMLENVEEFQQWGPIVDQHTHGCTGNHRRPRKDRHGHTIDWIDGKSHGCLPDCRFGQPVRDGSTFRIWVNCLRYLGYRVEWRELRACDYGTPTTRKRLFVVARCDGKAIVWPEKTHGTQQVRMELPAGMQRTSGTTGAKRPSGGGTGAARGCGDAAGAERSDHEGDRGLGTGAVGGGGAGAGRGGRTGGADRLRRPPLKPYRTAAECIDWSLPMCSIFATPDEAKAWGQAHGVPTPKRPLAEKTLRRIAAGVMRYVVNNPRPFVVDVNHGDSGGSRTRDIDSPAAAVTGSHGAAVVAPVMVKNNHGDKPHYGADEPVRTIVAGGTHHAVVAPVLSVYHSSKSPGDDRCVEAEEPLRTQDTQNRHAVVSALMVGAGGPEYAAKPKPLDKPFGTVMVENHAHLVAALLSKHRGHSIGTSLEEPVHTITAGGPPEGRGAASPHAMALTSAVLVQTSNQGGNGAYVNKPDEPHRTITTCHDQQLVAAHLAKHYGDSGRLGLRGSSPTEPLHTVTACDHNAVVAAHLAKHNGGNGAIGQEPTRPIDTVTGIDQKAVVASHLVKLKGNRGRGADGCDATDPLPTVCAGSTHYGVVSACMVPRYGERDGQAPRALPVDQPAPTVTPTANGGQLVGAFLSKYYSTGTALAADADAPAPTVTATDRLGLVTVVIDGETYVIVDIAMRMLSPRELARAQGFRDDYVIDRGHDGRRLSKRVQVRLIGNSVCRHVARALVRVNVVEQDVLWRAAA